MLLAGLKLAPTLTASSLTTALWVLSRMQNSKEFKAILLFFPSNAVYDHFYISLHLLIFYFSLLYHWFRSLWFFLTCIIYNILSNILLRFRWKTPTAFASLTSFLKLDTWSDHSEPLHVFTCSTCKWYTLGSSLKKPACSVVLIKKLNILNNN